MFGPRNQHPKPDAQVQPSKLRTQGAQPVNSDTRVWPPVLDSNREHHLRTLGINQTPTQPVYLDPKFQSPVVPKVSVGNDILKLDIPHNSYYHYLMDNGNSPPIS